MSNIKPKDFELKNGQKIIVRQAESEDAQALLDYTNKIFVEDKFFVTTLDDIRDKLNVGKSRERILKHQGKAGTILFVANLDGEIVGQIEVTNGHRKRIQHVGTVALTVLKEYRSLGVGTAMMNYIIDWANADELIEKLGLGVFANNHRAIGLYEKMGFSKEGRRPKEFKLGPNKYVDNILMYKFVK